MLQIQSISKSFDKKNIVLDQAGMVVQDYSKVAVIGKSGCGKTTLLNIIAGLLSPDDGEIIYKDFSLTSKSNSKERSDFRFNHVGIIPQRLCLINEYNVFQNIAYPLRLKGVKDNKFIIDKVKDIANRLNIAELLNKKTSLLSTGQCQRVALARAIITSPPILLADEPTSALDSETRAIVMSEFINYPGTVIIVSHDSHVISSCQEVFLIEDGRITKM
ncbi:MAG TPA: ABC transporter ATP-binding protein [Syntrophomonadaceae bacterium]|nr:ABC transporter ATP-binding protein [Syntrophomonadaceae bacterium]